MFPSYIDLFNMCMSWKHDYANSLLTQRQPPFPETTEFALTELIINYLFHLWLIFR